MFFRCLRGARGPGSVFNWLFATLGPVLPLAVLGVRLLVLPFSRHEIFMTVIVWFLMAVVRLLIYVYWMGGSGWFSDHIFLMACILGMLHTDIAYAHDYVLDGYVWAVPPLLVSYFLVWRISEEAYVTASFYHRPAGPAVAAGAAGGGAALRKHGRAVGALEADVHQGAAGARGALRRRGGRRRAAARRGGALPQPGLARRTTARPSRRTTCRRSTFRPATSPRSAAKAAPRWPRGRGGRRASTQAARRRARCHGDRQAST
ncbi:unnamed protein product [Prorocentrum cordatum]|uniref:Glycerophosphocholine acyltransferase 1 n=1 Tax=Prorocentrum cordatum TaxID=2364126 RepID=A0ABN9T7S2_9DINO|nr:unnamed protein product [Polarella glacialis]